MLEIAGLYWRTLKNLEIKLGGFEKRRMTYDKNKSIPLAAEIGEITAHLSLRGKIDLSELIRSGNLKEAEAREGFITQPDIKKINEAVKKLGEFGADTSLAYRFLSEIIHPASLSSVSYQQDPEIEVHRGLEFLRRDVAMPDDAPVDDLHGKIHSEIRRVLDETLSIIVRLCRKTEPIERLLTDFSKHYPACALWHYAKKTLW